MLECLFFGKIQSGSHLEIFECITSSQGKLQKLSNFQIILDSIFICYGYQAMQSQRQRECLFFWKKSKMAAKKPLSKIDRIFLIIFINRKSTQRHSTTKKQVNLFFFNRQTQAKNFTSQPSSMTRIRKLPKFRPFFSMIAP